MTVASPERLPRPKSPAIFSSGPIWPYLLVDGGPRREAPRPNSKLTIFEILTYHGNDRITVNSSKRVTVLMAVKHSCASARAALGLLLQPSQIGIQKACQVWNKLNPAYATYRARDFGHEIRLALRQWDYCIHPAAHHRNKRFNLIGGERQRLFPILILATVLCDETCQGPDHARFA